jgi:hypothetical protein
MDCIGKGTVFVEFNVKVLDMMTLVRQDFENGLHNQLICKEAEIKVYRIDIKNLNRTFKYQA